MKRKRNKQLKFVERKLGRERCRGQIFQGELLIEIDPRTPAKLKLATYIHEIMHYLQPNLSENKILKMERVMIRELWKLGVRLLAK